MKKNLLYLLVLVVLGAAVYYFVVKQRNTTLAEDEKSFAVEDTASIIKILIANMNGEKISLERKPDTWWVNGKYPARKDAVNLLLSTIKSIRVKYPVSESANDNVIKQLAAQNKKVEIYDRDNNLICSYYVGSPTPDNAGNYMKTEKGEHPFAVDIPGFNGTLETRYITDESDMRSRSIFNFPLNTIKQVKVDYTNKPDSSFIISVLGIDSFAVKRLNQNTAIDFKQIDKEKVGVYLSLFRFINAEAFDNNNKGNDTILIRKPFCTISLTDINSVVHSVVCYYKPVTETTLQQYDKNGFPLKYDHDHYYATMNDGNDFILIQQFHFGRLFKTTDFFLKTSSKKKANM